MTNSNVLKDVAKTFKLRWAWLSVPASSILQREEITRGSLWPRPCFATWYGPALYLIRGWGEARAPHRSWAVTAEGPWQQQQPPRRGGTQPLDVAADTLTAHAAALLRKTQTSRDCVAPRAAELCVFRGKRLSFPPAVILSLSSAGPEGEGAPVVPGLVTRPSIRSASPAATRAQAAVKGGRHVEVL